jgi:type I restriction enzyme R subunit
LSKTSENILEQTALNWFEELGWQPIFGPDISPDDLACERGDYHQVKTGNPQPRNDKNFEL